MANYRDSALPPLVIAGTRAVALDRATGRLVWTYDKGKRRFMRMHVLNDRVFLLDYDGTLHCLRLADGELLGVVPLKGGEATMLAVGDTLYVFTGEKVTAVDDAGRILWQTEIGFDGEWGLVGMGVPGHTIQPDFSRS